MRLRNLWRDLKSNPLMLGISSLLVVLVLGAFLLPVFSHADPNNQNLNEILHTPTWRFGRADMLGTDELGRSIGLRIIWGLRTSFIVAFSAVAFAAVAGISIGLLAGYFRGVVDAVLMRYLDIQFAVPSLLVAMALVRYFGGTPLSLAVFLAVVSWLLFARVTRSGVITIAESEFITNSRGIGASQARIMVTHILPNVVPMIVTTGTFALADVMLAEAGLSFLGLGIEPPGISLGATLADGQTYVSTAWWIAAFAGGLLALAVLSCNLVAHWLRGALDPQRS
jgi:peptide/nickel transport system permease protein